MTLQEALQLIRKRRDYLDVRIKSGSHFLVNDEEEREALTICLETLIDEEEEEFARNV